MRKFGYFCFFMFFCSVAAATPPTEESVETLVSVTKSEKLLDSVIDSAEMRMKQELDKIKESSHLSTTQKLVLDASQSKISGIIRDELSWSKMRPIYVQVYRESFTQEEVDGLITFYKSKVGQSYVDKMPLVLQKSYAITFSHMGKLTERLKVAIEETKANLVLARDTSPQDATSAADNASKTDTAPPDADMNICGDAANEQSVTVCTRLIDSGKLPAEVLPEVFYSRGLAWDKKKEYDKAIPDFDQAIKLNPNSSDFHYDRGLTWDEKGDYNKALADYNEAIKLNPNNANAYNNTAWTYHQMGDDSKGLPYADKAIALAPSDANDLETRAEIYEKLGQRDKAIADYQAAFKLDPGNQEVLDGLSRLGLTP